jgi:hypothetical protein
MGDPLAELARLIGQDEAFGAIVRGSPKPEPRPEPPPRKAEEPPPPWCSRPSQPHAEWDRDDTQTPHDPRGATADALSRHFGSHDPIDADAHAPAPPEHDAPAFGAPAHDPHAYDPHAHDPHAHDPHAHDPHAYEADAAHAGDQAYATAGDGHPDDQAQPHHDAYAAGEYYEDDETHLEDDYADAPLERRRGGLVIVGAVLGLALVGSAGAFGYWAWSGGSGGNGEPPLIKADTTPSKIVPATQSGDAAANKRIYDRIGEKGGNAGERVVPREESPVDVKAGAPRQINPSAGGVYGPAPASPAPTQAAALPQPSGVPASAEPRKVHTETIRPNQLANLDPAAAAPPPAAPPPSAAPAAKQGSARSKQGAAPVLLGAQSPAAEPTDAPPPARAAAPAGGYVVQLSAQRSEEEAQASFRALQTKYPAVLGSRQPLISRADLGDKGVFYRARVGPFPTIGEANQVCESLKSAGGHCIVQKN